MQVELSDHRMDGTHTWSGVSGRNDTRGNVNARHTERRVLNASTFQL